MCLCDEWMVYGDNGGNGGSLILLLLFQGDTYLSCFLKLCEENEMLFFFFSLRWVSCTPNSTVGHLSIFTSRLTFPFLSRFRSLAPFYFLVSFFFFKALISWDNIASGSNKITWAFISQGKNIDVFGYSLLN